MKQKTTTINNPLTGIGQTVLLRRTALGLKYQDLENRSGISSVTLSKLEKGALENTSLDTLARIAGALGMKLEISLK